MRNHIDETYQDILDKVKNIHFIGIGGSGMCPLAEILLSEGFNLTGSDTSQSDTLERIRSYGITVFMGHKASNISNAELVVYTAAVKADNPELVEAKNRNIPCLERSQMLGIVSRRYNRTIAISGTHGKTSTTAMLSQILIGSNFDPSAIIGGKLPFIGGNSYVGNSDILVCEACEYVDSFLQLTPYISVILNIDADHLDYFGSLENIQKSFNQFAKQTSGMMVINGDDQNTINSLTDITIPRVTFGFNPDNDYYATNIQSSTGANNQFDLMHKGEKLTTISLIVPGEHNIYNAMAAATVAHILGATPREISDNLHNFGGVHRRFEFLGKVNGITVADDFAHHPTELTATLMAAKNMNFNRVWAVFQPHTFSRTAMLLDDFAKALSIPDRAIISEILPVRETNTYNIYSTDLGAKVPNSVCIDKFEDIANYVCQNASEGDLVLTLGGGNIYMCANMILNTLKQKYE